MIEVLDAAERHRRPVLGFCKDTFSWGDYIDQVWDLWLGDNSGRTLVAELEGRPVGLSHVSVCPGRQSVWLEGVRVHPAHRRSRVATLLVNEMLGFGLRAGAASAHAIVARENAASQRMMEKAGFSSVSEWSYFSTSGPVRKAESVARPALPDELDAVCSYLASSGIYRDSAERYVCSWRWYPLDRQAIAGMIGKGRVIVAGNPANGVAVLNRHGYWNNRDVLQVVYLDSGREQGARDLVAFAANVYSCENYARLQILCQADPRLNAVIGDFGLKESERFLLYSRLISG